MGTVIQDIIAKKSLIKAKLNVSNEGMLTVGYGGVYVSLGIEEAEYLIPLLCQDEFGNVHPVIKGTDRDDTLRIVDTTASQGDAGEGTPDA